MDRMELRSLAEARRDDAQALLPAQRWAGAYYVAGYSVECALKACAARLFRQDDIPEPGLVRALYTHNLEELANRAGLADPLARQQATDPVFRIYWQTVPAWRETSSRYSSHWTQAQAEGIVNALADPDHGVLAWLQQYW